MGKYCLNLFVVILMVCWEVNIFAQEPPNELALARQFSLSQDYEKSISIFEKLYKKSPFDKSLYNELYNDIIAYKDYNKAIEIAKYMQSIRHNDVTIVADIAYAYELKGDKKQSVELWKNIYEQAIRDNYQLTLVAELLQKRSMYDKAIQLYEYARKNYGQEQLFAQELATLYSLSGDKIKAINAIFDVAATSQASIEDLKNKLSNIINNDSKLEKEVSKELKKRMLKLPNQLIMELWVWHRINTNDWINLLEDVTTLDKQHEANGMLALQTAIMLYQNDKQEQALQAFQLTRVLSTNQQFKKDVLLYENLILKQQILANKPIDKQKAQIVANNFEELFEVHPSYILNEVYLDYIEVLGIFLNKLDTAIVLLQDFIKKPQLRKDIRAKAKIKLGDYLLIKGEHWESTLLYAQVDKGHKEDALGELAKYKNAQLSYFIGDFDWAQMQLKVLKAASSDMIANDALYLSILITENMPPDSNLISLKTFAQADLLLHQYKTAEAKMILNQLLKDSINESLTDDIYMMLAKIAIEEGDYNLAVQHLEIIYTQYKDDVLADDALWRLGELFEIQFKDKARAKKYYELIITEFPSSTYIQLARQKFKHLALDAL